MLKKLANVILTTQKNQVNNNVTKADHDFVKKLHVCSVYAAKKYKVDVNISDIVTHLLVHCEESTIEWANKTIERENKKEN